MRGETHKTGPGAAAIPTSEFVALDGFPKTALLWGHVGGSKVYGFEVDEERVVDSGLLSMTRELRMRLDVCVCASASARCFGRPLLPPDFCAFCCCSQSATSSSFAFSSGSQVVGHALPVLGSVPFHLIWYFLTPLTMRSSRIHSASQSLELSSPLASLLLESTYLGRLFGFVLV